MLDHGIMADEEKGVLVLHTGSEDPGLEGPAGISNMIFPRMIIQIAWNIAWRAAEVFGGDDI